MLVVRQVAKNYPTRSGPLSVLRGVDLEMRPGDALAIMGPSGSGKSTLLYILGTLDEPTAGTVRLGDFEPFTLSARALAAFRNRQIGFVFQDHHLLPQCSVLENVLVPTLVGNDDPAAVKKRAHELLDRVGLGHRLEHRPAELSGGERQRVAVARSLIHRPALLLADEPTGNLDRVSARAVGELLIQMCAEGQHMLVAVTHSAELAKMFPRVCLVEDGKLVAAPLS